MLAFTSPAPAAAAPARAVHTVNSPTANNRATSAPLRRTPSPANKAAPTDSNATPSGHW